MIVIRLQGGLGNQLFQYALYLQLLHTGRDVFIDDVHGYTDDNQRKPVLEDYFRLSYRRPSEKDYYRLTDSYPGFVNRIARNLRGRHSLEYCERSDSNYDPRVMDMTDVYLNGYWQSERFFPDPEVRARLKRELNPPRKEPFNGAVSQILLSSIRETQSVSLHVRRGDYLLPGTRQTHGDICDDAYYARAIQRVKSLYPEAEFYVFSDDRQWAKETFSIPGFIVAEPDDEPMDRTEFWLMSACRHHILANSSYSWWAAWLSADVTGMVIAPSRWYNTKETTDIYTERMIRL